MSDHDDDAPESLIPQPIGLIREKWLVVFEGGEVSQISDFLDENGEELDPAVMNDASIKSLIFEGPTHRWYFADLEDVPCLTLH